MHTVTLSEISWRILGAFIAGAIIGWERETHGRAAGLRTTILACVAAALAMIISVALFMQTAAMPGLLSWRPDPARLGAGVLTGIGFLGGGAILRHGNYIRGVTTAASLWFATMIGLALGSGLFALAAIGLVVAMVTLNLLPAVERHIRKDAYATLKITARPETMTVPQLKMKLDEIGLDIVSLKLCSDREKGVVKFVATLKMTKQEVLDKAERTVALFSAAPGVIRVNWS
jgi:putative Mg2+ transporter-C (MgtC) family protein